MTTSINLRTATADEQATLQRLLANSPTAIRRLKEGAENALVLWAASCLGLIALWLGLGWVAGKAFALDLGMRSHATLWVVAVVIPASAVFAVVSSAKWARGWEDYRPLLRDDLAAAQVREETYTFTEARRFQEPEHGGLLYLLRVSEDEVFAFYDLESQVRGTDDQDPLQGSYRPQSDLRIVRAPTSGFILSSTSSGDVLSVGPPIELALAPAHWPEQQTTCDIPWSHLEARLGTPRQTSSAQSSDA